MTKFHIEKKKSFSVTTRRQFALAYEYRFFADPNINVTIPLPLLLGSVTTFDSADRGMLHILQKHIGKLPTLGRKWPRDMQMNRHPSQDLYGQLLIEPSYMDNKLSPGVNQKFL